MKNAEVQTETEQQLIHTVLLNPYRCPIIKVFEAYVSHIPFQTYDIDESSKKKKKINKALQVRFTAGENIENVKE